MNTKIENKDFIIFAEGRWDANTSDSVKAELDAILPLIPEECTRLILDMRGLSYISSKGIRLLMHLQKSSPLPLVILNVSRGIFEILEMTGITEIIDVRRRLRRINIEGCELIGIGGRANVYRLNQDTIVKVYFCSREKAEELIRSEQEKARLAFVQGIQTAIPYDMVLVGDKFGSVFELVNAHSFHSIYISDPLHSDDLVKEYVAFLKNMHSKEIISDKLPMASRQLLRELDCIRDLVTEEQYLRVKELLEALPEDYHLVHGDYQMKNVMLSEGIPVVIDMDTMCTGQDIFDLQALYVTYRAFPEDDPNEGRDFLQTDSETISRLWKKILMFYFNTEDPASLSALEDEISVVGSIHFLYLLRDLGLDKGELAERRIQHTKEHLTRVLPGISKLNSWS